MTSIQDNGPVHMIPVANISLARPTSCGASMNPYYVLDPPSTLDLDFRYDINYYTSLLLSLDLASEDSHNFLI